MKYIKLASLFFFFNLCAQNDHLEPVSGLLNNYEHRFEYSKHIRNILFNGLGEFSELRYYVSPSFKNEHVLDISRGNPEYLISYHIAEKSIWYSKDKEQVRVKKVRKIISKEDTKLLKKLYFNAIYKARYIYSEFAILDGTGYVFSVNEKGIKTGQAHSPNKGTKIYDLVDISNRIIESLNNEESNLFTISSKLRKEIKRLTNTFIITNNKDEISFNTKSRNKIIEYLNDSVREDDKTKFYKTLVFNFNHLGKVTKIYYSRYDTTFYGEGISERIEHWLEKRDLKKDLKYLNKRFKNFRMPHWQLEAPYKLKVNLKFQESTNTFF